MLTGKRFRLNLATLAIENLFDHRVAVQVPLGTTITVLSGPHPHDSRMMDVLWEHRPLVMFAEDVVRCGQEIGDGEKA
jgi:hypothetical protein